MIPLVIGPREVEAIQEVVDYAISHPIERRELAWLAENPSEGVVPEHGVLVPVGFECFFTVERQSIGLCRHLSVTSRLSPPGRAPSPEAVAMLMEHFGFSEPLRRFLLAPSRATLPPAETSKVWLCGDHPIHVNVLEAVQP